MAGIALIGLLVTLALRDRDAAANRPRVFVLTKPGQHSPVSSARQPDLERQLDLLGHRPARIVAADREVDLRLDLARSLDLRA